MAEISGFPAEISMVIGRVTKTCDKTWLILLEGGGDPSGMRNSLRGGREARALPGAGVPAGEGWRLARTAPAKPAGLLRMTESASAVASMDNGPACLAARGSGL